MVGANGEKSSDREAILEAILATAVDGIVTIDHDGIIKSFNAAAERLFGYQAAETTGHNVKMLMPEPFHSEHDSYISNFIRTGDSKIIGIGREVVGLRKDGTTFPIDLAVSEVLMEGPPIFTGILRDISERKRAEA